METIQKATSPLKWLENKVKIDDPEDAFFIFKENWDSKDLDKTKGAQAILIDNSDQAFAVCQLPSPKNVPISNSPDFRFDTAALIQIAKKEKAKSVIIAENFLRDDIDVDNERFDNITKIKHATDGNGVIVKDYMSIYNNGYTTLTSELVSE